MCEEERRSQEYKRVLDSWHNDLNAIHELHQALECRHAEHTFVDFFLHREF